MNNFNAEIDISILDPKWQQTLPDLEIFISDTIKTALIEAALPQKLAPNNQFVEVSVLLANNAFIKDLNHRYRGKNKPTNVLSFSQLDITPKTKTDEEIFPIASLGDIALAYETIAQEAKEHNKAIEDHIRHLLIHGSLHLCGFDHENAKDAEEMENLEIKILSSFGIKNPYEIAQAVS